MTGSRCLVVAALAGVLVAPGATAAEDGAVECRGTIRSIVVDEVVVPRGAFCRLEGTTVRGDVSARTHSVLQLREATVEGDVTAGPDAELTVVASRVEGELGCVGCFPPRLLNSSVAGDVRLAHAVDVRIHRSSIGGALEISRADSFELPVSVNGSTIHGDVRIHRSHGEWFVVDNDVGGDLELVRHGAGGAFCLADSVCLTVRRNGVGGSLRLLRTRGRAEVVRNTVGQELACFANDPPPVGHGNVAAAKLGQCSEL